MLTASNLFSTLIRMPIAYKSLIEPSVYGAAVGTFGYRPYQPTKSDPNRELLSGILYHSFVATATQQLVSSQRLEDTLVANVVGAAVPAAILQLVRGKDSDWINQSVKAGFVGGLVPIAVAASKKVRSMAM